MGSQFLLFFKLEAFFVFFNQHPFSFISTLFPFILQSYAHRSCFFFFFFKLKASDFFSATTKSRKLFPQVEEGPGFERLSLDDFVGVLPNKECRGGLWQENRAHFLDGYNSLKKQISGTKNKNFTSAQFYRGQENVSSQKLS